jgi:leader peptidase (prepilin peptidase)/N-methyltransferase
MLDMLADLPLIFVAVAFAFALVLGSFINVVIYRLPIMMELEWRAQCRELEETPAPELPKGRFNLIVPRSRCPSCGANITPWQNIPVLSYLMLGGRCASCKKDISARYPAVELVTAMLVAVVAWRFGATWQGLMGIVLTLLLVPITMIDFDRYLIPDSIVYPLLWIGLAMSLWHPQAGADVLFIPTRDAIIGAIAGYLSLWSFYWLFKLATGKEGMGYGGRGFRDRTDRFAWQGSPGAHALWTVSCRCRLDHDALGRFNQAAVPVLARHAGSETSSDWPDRGHRQRQVDRCKDVRGAGGPRRRYRRYSPRGCRARHPGPRGNS